ncbi:UBA-like protein [Cynara cardunculus var. scolymus]|uniref:UBA-like protein n=1 Tax=Cynara cardunculus var. scolymus TaxID=59895 RepID=A0A103YM84_CYNCS|nr:UBA-like protein [Cynara cardunculus var. scolymus]
MSAVVCGKRSSFFEDHNVPSSSSASPPISKRIRCSSSSPVRYSSTTSSRFIAIDRLILLFPQMDKQLLEKALNECGDDIETAIKSLTELRLGTVENFASVVNSAAGNESNLQFQTQANGVANGDAVPVEHSALQSQPVDGADWVNLFVREMLSASNMDDARTRASRALELLEKSITERDNVMMKEQLQVVIQENALLKRAVTIQHERRKEFEDRDQELHNLKQMVSQYQEQLRTLEVNNYSLTMNLKQAQQGNSIPGRFHPDVF